MTRRQHFTVDRGAPAGSRGAPGARTFRSRKEAQNLAQRVWTCKVCRRQHAKKPAFCSGYECTSSDFWYFQSQKEADRFAALALWHSHGIIDQLEVHPIYVLTAPRWTKDPADPQFEIVQEIPIGRYIADFRYVRAGKRVVEDVKARPSAASMDPLFHWKRRHVEAQFGITIETYT